MKCSGMFYSLETNQNEIMMSSFLGGNQNRNLYWKTWDLCIVSKLCLVCSKRAWNLVWCRLVYFPRSKTKGVVMFYSLETNLIKKMKSNSRRGGQNSNL